MSDGKQWPKSIIIGTRDMMVQFERETHGLPLTPSDFQEIVTQILDLLLNFGPDGCSSYQAVPDVSRLYQQEWPDPEQFCQLKNASLRLAWAIHQVCADLGFRTTLREDGSVTLDFPYAWSGWHGRDVVLDHMPY
jgi:hypothetical protein